VEKSRPDASGRFSLDKPDKMNGAVVITVEFFREPDAQLGFLWGGATMGQLLSAPLFLAGVGFIIYALKRPPLRSR
jgi:prolipoprotein diacylglyceryltransferase